MQLVLAVFRRVFITVLLLAVYRNITTCCPPPSSFKTLCRVVLYLLHGYLRIMSLFCYFFAPEK
jgi:hypothetical protein